MELTQKLLAMVEETDSIQKLLLWQKVSLIYMRDENVPDEDFMKICEIFDAISLKIQHLLYIKKLAKAG